MQLKINTEALLKALVRIGIATHCETLPILSSIKIEAVDKFVIISATDLDIFITERVEAKVAQKGATVVAYRLLSAFIARATSKDTQMRLEAEIFVVTHGDNRANLGTLPIDEFPPNLDIKDDAQKFGCDALELVTPLKKVAHAMSTDESRSALLGTNINSQNGSGCDIVATDSRRVALFKSSLKIEKINIILPRIAVEAICKVFEFGGEAQITMSDTMMSIATATSEIRSRLIEANFPNYQTVIPEPMKDAFSAQKKDFIEAISTAALFLTSKEIGVRIAGFDREIEVSCFDRFKTKILGTELSGQPDLEKHVNSRFLLDTLNVLDNDTVRIEVSENLPLVFREGAFTEVINGLNPAIVAPEV